MIRKLFFIFAIICMTFIGSCNEPQEEKTPTFNVTFDEMLGEELIVKVVEEGKTVEYFVPKLNEGFNFIGWTLDISTNELFDFNTVITENINLYAVWEEDVPAVKDYSYIIDEYVPDVLTTSIELPRTLDDLNLIWSTSNNYTLTNNGELFRSRVDEKVTVYLTVYDYGVTTSFEKEVTVKAIEFKELDSNNLVFGYYSTWNFFGYTDMMLETCDVINLCFGYVTADFKVDATSIIPYINQVLKAREAGIRVVLSIQGYSTAGTNFSKAASTDAGRRSLAESMLRVIEKYHLDGIDIDWEYPGYNTGTSVAVDKANYTLLCKQIVETLKAANPDYLVTAAIPGGSNGTSRFDLGSVAKYLDYIHIMTYDVQNGSYATHHSPLYKSSATLSGCSVQESVNSYISCGVPKSKIVIGLAFYGKRTKATSLGGRASGGYKAIVYTALVEDYLSRIGNGVTYGFDEAAQAPYLLDTQNGYFITYEDEYSIAAKCKFAVDQNIAGVMIWEIGEDTTGTLITAVNKGIK